MLEASERSSETNARGHLSFCLPPGQERTAPASSILPSRGCISSRGPPLAAIHGPFRTQESVRCLLNASCCCPAVVTTVGPPRVPRKIEPAARAHACDLCTRTADVEESIHFRETGGRCGAHIRPEGQTSPDRCTTANHLSAGSRAFNEEQQARAEASAGRRPQNFTASQLSRWSYRETRLGRGRSGPEPAEGQPPAAAGRLIRSR